MPRSWLRLAVLRVSVVSATSTARSLVDVPSMTVTAEIEAPAGTTNTLVRLGDGLLGHGGDGTVRLDDSTGAPRRWSIDDASEECIRSTVIESIGRFYCADVHRRGRLDDGLLLDGVRITNRGAIIAWSPGGKVTMYDLESLEPLRTLPGSRGYVQDMQSDHAGSMMAARGGDGNVGLYDGRDRCRHRRHDRHP